ncbi:MAG: c-type cytochrome [Bacillota bacterium]
MKSNVKFILFVGLLVLVLTLAVGCGKKDTQEPATDTTNQTQTDATATEQDQTTDNSQATDTNSETATTDDSTQATDTAAAGDSVKGKEYVEANGCTGCHIISGQGGAIGPDLTKVGSKYDAAGVKTFLTSKHPSPFAGTEEELTNVAEYLASLK